jgi:hypothetical protein
MPANQSACFSYRCGYTLVGPMVATVNIVQAGFSNGVFGFSAARYSFSEAAAVALVTVVRVGGTRGTTTLSYNTSAVGGGSATATPCIAPSATAPCNPREPVNADYLASSGQLTFGPGVMRQYVSVRLYNDVWYEGTEHFRVDLSTASGPGQLAAGDTFMEVWVL